MREEIEGKFVGLERVIVDTRYGQLLSVCIIIIYTFLFYRRYVDEIKELLVSMKEKEL